MRSVNNHPVSPYDFFHYPDSVFPSMDYIILEPADDTTLINSKHELLMKRSIRMSDSYYNAGTINIKGGFYIYPKILDRGVSETARLFVHKVNIFINGRIRFSMTMDSTAFSFSRQTPLMFRSDLDVSDSRYYLNPHGNTDTWLYDEPLPVLYSDSDTIITVTAEDFNNNRSILTLKINNGEKDTEHRSYSKLFTAHGKPCFVLSGNEEMPDMSDNWETYGKSPYRYFVFSPERTATGHINDYNALSISKNDRIHLPGSVEIEALEDISVLYNNSSPVIEGFKAFSLLHSFYLNRRYLQEGINLIIHNHAGHSLYVQSGDSYRFHSRLTGSDTVNMHYVSSFIIGRDTVPPASRFISETVTEAGTALRFRLIDPLSGIDWYFVSDSNTIYNIPDPQMGFVDIYYNNSSGSRFTVKDKEGNSTIIDLSAY